jgi:hypothetical protein
MVSLLGLKNNPNSTLSDIYLVWGGFHRFQGEKNGVGHKEKVL